MPAGRPTAACAPRGRHAQRRSPAWRSRLGVAAALALVGLVVGLSTSLGPTGAGTAAAAPAVSVIQVRHRLNVLGVREAKAAEAYDTARVSLAAARRRVRRLDEKLAGAKTQSTAARRRLAALAVAAYQGAGGVDSGELSVLLTSDARTFVQSSSDLQLVSRSAGSILTRYLHAVRVLAAERATAVRDERHAAAVARRLAAERRAVLAAIAARRGLLAQLSAVQRAQVTVAEPPARPRPAPPSITGGAVSVVRFAYAQLGKPYQWGAAGPDSYDCSGLAMAAWATAGVSLPHSAADQQAMSTPVGPGSLNPGDLIFFGSPAYHVGIYIGNGEMIDAPYTGVDVRIDPIGGYTSAGRP